jgi:hypothetical protein
MLSAVELQRAYPTRVGVVRGVFRFLTASLVQLEAGHTISDGDVLDWLVSEPTVHFIQELATSTRGVYDERGLYEEEQARQPREQAVFGTPRVRLLLLQRLVHDVLLEGDGLATEANTNTLL